MQSEFIVYKKFRIKEDALGLQELLESKGVPAELGESTAPVDITFSNQKIDQMFEVRIEGSHFEKADEVLKEAAEKLLSRIDPDYYLFDFTNKELIEILTKPDEWGDLDQHLAAKLLRDRGKGVSEEELEKLRKDRIDELAQPEKDQQLWIIFGYISAICGGLVGLIIGYMMLKSMKTLPNGTQVQTYSPRDLRHAKNIYHIGLVVFPLVLLMGVVNAVFKLV